MDIEGKVAIVTGGGGGVGRATSVALARRGCSVVVNYSRSADAAEETAAAVREAGPRALPFQADVSDDAACRAMVDATVRELGGVDVLINNAGTTTFVPHANLDALDEEAWRSIMAVNVAGPFQCARAVFGPMQKAGSGEIVNVSSVAGIAGTGSSIPYCASKAALNNLTLTLARALAPAVRVNAVAPGFIAGKWLEQGLGAGYEPIKQHYESISPLGQVCTGEDVADAILSLVTGSDLVTGQILAVEGGALLGR